MAKNYVCDGAKIECKLCTKPEGTLVVTSNTVKVQDKNFATANDNQKMNLLFQGNCVKSPFQASPCLAVIAPGSWQGTADLIVQDAPALLESAVIMCNYGGVPITITDHLQVNEPTQIQPTNAPVISPVEDATIASVEWMSNKTTAESESVKILHPHDEVDIAITEASKDEKVWLEIMTQNVMPGQEVTLTLEDEEDANSDPIVLSVPVDNRGKAVLLINTKADIQTNERILVEKGMVRKGYTKNEGNRKVIVNELGQKGYDWIYADEPSESLMRQNGMSSYDVLNVNATKSHPEILLKAAMKAVLLLCSDVEDGFGKNGINLANHFFTGGGSPYIFDTNSNPAKEIKDSSQFKDFLKNLKEELKQRYDENCFVNRAFMNNYQFSTALPYYDPISGVINPNTNEIAAFVGGIQGAIVNYEVYKNEGITEIVLKRISFLDTFGAGWEDGGANGMKKQWIPGLVAMFCLQHFKNVSDKSKFQLFMVIIDIVL